MRVMPIIRSRTGCFTCRRRKKKCNEEKPVCSGCRRNKLDCRWPELSATAGLPTRGGSKPLAPDDPTIKQHASSSADATSPRACPSCPPSYPQQPRTQTGTQTQTTPKLERDRDHDHDHDHDCEPSRLPFQRADTFASSTSADSLSTQSPQARSSPVCFYAVSSSAEAGLDDAGADSPEGPRTRTGSCSVSPDMDVDTDYGVQDVVLAHHLAAVDAGALLHQQQREAAGLQRTLVTLPMTLLPCHGHDSYELLSYYLSRTANSMGNGSTAINPFIAKLIPLAFSNPLVLQLILAQSAAHRQASKEPDASNEVAQRYYTDSLRMFRNVVGEYVSGKDENTLTLTVGSLILCLTEVARGDICGTIFDHLTASKSLLTTLLSRLDSHLFGDLPDFLVEYYMHTAASSIISTDLDANSPPPLSPSIEQMARTLVDRNYIGQLCGCWLELLLLIPQVFQLAKSMLPRGGIQGQPPSNPPSADDIITFGFLQSQILAFSPSLLASPYSQLAGLVFKQGLLLYLWSIMGTPQQGCSTYKHLLEGAVSEAVSLLSQFPASARVNTSLCWPLAVIGCCTSDPAVQEVIRSRLQTMIDTIGLGNMRETLVLLEHVWRQPVEETSPWTLRRTMQEHQIWISFA